jgi:hypothetical protein
MKHTLKGWLVDNAVTVDNKEDKILMLESAGSLTLEDILSEMKKEDRRGTPEKFKILRSELR